MRLTEITDDLTGAADSGSYFTARGRKVRICTNGRCSLEHETDEILTVNLSSRNTAQDKARQLHADLLRRLEPGGFYMKKIGTGFRGNDSYELDGLLDGWPDYNVFIVDNAPDLGTFTLYGNQYCEGEILPKSVYANDPIFPPTESYIPKILGKDTDKKIGLVDIDAVKGGEETLLAAVEHQLAEETRILVFDAIARADVLHLLKTLAPRYPKVFWTGSLGIADGLAEYLYGPAQPHTFLCGTSGAFASVLRPTTSLISRSLILRSVGCRPCRWTSTPTSRAAKRCRSGPQSKQSSCLGRGASSSFRGWKNIPTSPAPAKLSWSALHRLRQRLTTMPHSTGWSSSAARLRRACSGSSALSICSSAAHWNPAWHRA